MLIQSQDRKVIVNTNTLVCLYREKCDIRCITTNSEDDYGYLMPCHTGDYLYVRETWCKYFRLEDDLVTPIDGTEKYY